MQPPPLLRILPSAFITLAALRIAAPPGAAAQTGEVLADSAFISTAPDSTPANVDEFPAADSLYRELARLDINRAQVNLRETGFWSRLMPKVQVGGTIGVRELVFQDPGGALVLPRDSYRLSFSLSVSDLLDGSKHDLALLELRKAQLSFAMLLGKQSAARHALARRLHAMEQDLRLQTEELRTSRALAAYLEILFRQGKADFRVVTGARMAMVRSEHNLRKTESQLGLLKRELERKGAE